LVNYALYPLAAARISATATPTAGQIRGVVIVHLNDTTTGNNSVPGQPGFSAGIGYDLVTGWLCDAANLVQAFVTRDVGLLATTTALVANGPRAVQHGQPYLHRQRHASFGHKYSTETFLLSRACRRGGTGLRVTVDAGALTNGVFAGSFANLPGGQYNVSAHYPATQISRPVIRTR